VGFLVRGPLPRPEILVFIGKVSGLELLELLQNAPMGSCHLSKPCSPLQANSCRSEKTSFLPKNLLKQKKFAAT
jgi:hypothetical protein